MIDFKKAVRTRDGREVKIYDTEAGGCYPIHGAFRSTDGDWEVSTWTREGMFAGDRESHLDLVEGSGEHEIWLNIYTSSTQAYQNRAAADYRQGSGRIACVRVKYNEGEGL